MLAMSAFAPRQKVPRRPCEMVRISWASASHVALLRAAVLRNPEGMSLHELGMCGSMFFVSFLALVAFCSESSLLAVASAGLLALRFTP